MESRQALADMEILETAGRVGRATHLWLRQNHTPSLSGFRAQCLAAGFIAEICDALELSLRHGIFAAHTYALLEDGEADSLRIAEVLVNIGTGTEKSAVFEQGRRMAVTMLALIESGGNEMLFKQSSLSATRFPC